MLRDVSWEELGDQLGLAGQSTAIETGCSTEIRAVRATCYLKAVVKRYIQTQSGEACKESVQKIVNALKGLGNRYEKEATNLIAEFKLGEFGEFANTKKALSTFLQCTRVHVYSTRGKKEKGKGEKKEP